MKTRATITLQPELYARAKRIAKLRRTTVSGLFESYLAQQPDPETSVVDELTGAACLKAPTSGPDARRRHLVAKYLK